MTTKLYQMKNSYKKKDLKSIACIFKGAIKVIKC